MKRILSTLLIATLLLTTVITGCGKKTESENGSTNIKDDSQTTETTKKEKLSIMIWDNEDVIKGALDLFKEAYPDVEVEVNYVDNKQYDNILNTKLAAGEGPDVFQVGANIQKLAAAGRVLDLTSEDFIDKYHESGTELGVYEGKNYLIPWMSWMEGIFYNEELFAEAGITKIPETWNEFLDVHEKLKQAGIKPQTMGAKSWEPMLKQSMALVSSGFYQKDENKDWGKKFGNGEVKMSGAWDDYSKAWSEIVKRGYLTPDMLGMDYEQAQDEFAMGKAAMWESGNWAVNTIKEKNPNLKFNFFPIPAIEGKGFLIGGAGAGWAINGATKKVDLAKEFLRFWSTEEAQIAAQKGYGGGVFLKGVETPLPENMSGALEALSEGRIYCPWNEWYGAQAIIVEYGKAMQDYLSTSGQDEDILLDVLNRTDEKRDQMLETKQ